MLNAKGGCAALGPQQRGAAAPFVRNCRELTPAVVVGPKRQGASRGGSDAYRRRTVSIASRSARNARGGLGFGDGMSPSIIWRMPSLAVAPFIGPTVARRKGMGRAGWGRGLLGKPENLSALTTARRFVGARAGDCRGCALSFQQRRERYPAKGTAGLRRIGPNQPAYFLGTVVRKTRRVLPTLRRATANQGRSHALRAIDYSAPHRAKRRRSLSDHRVRSGNVSAASALCGSFEGWSTSASPPINFAHSKSAPRFWKLADI
jgi:hypothetical protein